MAIYRSNFHDPILAPSIPGNLRYRCGHPKQFHDPDVTCQLLPILSPRDPDMNGKVYLIKQHLHYPLLELRPRSHVYLR